MSNSVIIAGASGLVGRETLQAMLQCDKVDSIFNLSRSAIDTDHRKLTQIINDKLDIPHDHALIGTTDTGIIALGTTLKKAGSKEKLRAIDVDLVVKTANKMKSAGIKHLIIVSCLGAKPNATSHYLRCKGEMEVLIEAMNFERTTFLHPGPLAGKRNESRTDEKVLHFLLNLAKPIMVGKLKNYLPIQAKTIAHSIVKIINTPVIHNVERLNSSALNEIAK